MTDIIKFVQKPLSDKEFMRHYRDECTMTGTPASPDKCISGDPGTITTTDGDVLNACQPAAEPR